MGDKYASERFDPTYSTCKASLRLEFDGSELRIMIGERVEARYPAVSGKPDAQNAFDYSALYQHSAGRGPIPEGTYWVDPSEIADLSWRPWIPGSAWGDYRWTIHPFTTTQTFGRGGFFIHGGKYPGSAGCIDLTDQISAFIEKVRSLVGGVKSQVMGKGASARIPVKCQLHLKVEYP